MTFTVTRLGPDTWDGFAEFVERNLVAPPHGDGLGLLGTNFGQEATPSWALNLEASPHATVTHRGITREVLARPAMPQEAGAIFAEAATFYPGYRNYRRRVGDRRRIRVFVLERADAPMDTQNG
jgi:deazaflavin-dependent oxidoreductase (nitroreductase family)